MLNNLKKCILCVAEKPSVAREITAVLNVKSKKIASQSIYNPIYQFEFKGNQYVFTSVAGHLTINRFPDRYKNWHQTDMSHLFHATIENIEDPQKKELIQNLKTLSKNCQELILFTDCDQEGEAIGYILYQVSGLF